MSYHEWADVRWYTTLTGIALLGAAAAWLAHGKSHPREADAAQVQAAPAAASPERNADPALVRAVALDVDRRNKEEQKDREAFLAAGWTLVDTAPPDQALVDFDPALLETREAELRAQLLSAAAPPERAGQILVIAEHAKDPATRIAAAEALGRMGRDGQAALADLVAGGKLAPGDPARAIAMAAILPSDDDKTGATR